MAIDWSFLGETGADGGFQLNPQFLQMLAQTGAGLGKGQSVGEALGGATSQTLRMRTLMGKNPLVPTPKGQPGPDAITTKQTADGTTTTIQTPSQRNLDTYGTSVPSESMPGKSDGGVSDQSPFWRALLGME